MSKNRWTLKPFDTEKRDALQKALGVHPIICQLLIQRGIETYEAAHRFFRPSLEHLHDPFLMKDMDIAIERLLEAEANGEKILIYGDYDVDGTTAVALVYSYLKDFFKDHIDFYIPDRYAEGYGISYRGIDFAAENNFSLIIALDCGIKAVEKIDYANEKGIDFIICDHHLPGTKVPAAKAVLDPKQSDCKYPFKELSGCGIGFKLMQALVQKKELDYNTLTPLLDLLAVSIAADIVPITGENRILAYFGLQQINHSPRPAFQAMMDQAGKSQNLDISNLVFVLAPRINAAGRMASGKDAVQLLIAENLKESDVLSFDLEENNTARKQKDKEITRQALGMLEQNKDLQERSTTVLWNPSWHKGVIGIVASRLIENYYRPTIIFTITNGMATGSARSVKGFNVHTALEACTDFIEQFGGHKYAAGLSVKEENLEAFRDKFDSVVSETIEEKSLQPEIEIDAELDLNLATNEKFYQLIQQFAPCGPGNMRPVFLSTKLRNAGYSKIVKTEHLKLDLVQNYSDKAGGIAFGHAEHHERVCNDEFFQLVYSLDLNEWNGKTNVQLMVKDIKFDSDEA